MANIVYIGASLDGFITDKNNRLDWLHELPNPEGLDLGFADFMARVDAIIMGRNTFETIQGFDCEWPYNKPVFVLSNTLKEVPKVFADKVSLVQGELTDIVEQLAQQGFKTLYIDGGKTIQSFLQQDLIDELIITTIPTILGGGTPLFGTLNEPLKFKHVNAVRYLDCVVKNYYVRQR
ncbi:MULTISPECIES: dihydrofolate reductase family protein [Pseudoalteromonas]|uniref:dihydrofolate reductase family protein n=1 Tax=Pseudoalteromonas TaxID=53246 RepID=UPI000FFE591E|nr:MULTISPECIES: dihydrofolate reductase family protein [Pseudoalteromonas]MCG9759649.1 dihydrofolate reductase family protein [Pseudoalteromonas sp. Isolate6]NKC20996.1 dihydrofolate reductase [Pseudoalteromonas galatheae]RXE86413.1 dihydrofolate reductase [Pseudoalteromonas sp. A757]